MIRFTTATDPGCCISVQPRKDAHWRDQESAALPNGIALAPARGKDWPVCTWGTVARHIGTALRGSDAFREYVRAELARADSDTPMEPS